MSELEDEAKKVEVKSISGKVLAFGFITIAAVLAVFCIIMSSAFFIVSNKYVDKSDRVIEQAETISTIQRALDRAEGRLYVYEAYLTNRNVDIMRQMIARFLKNTNKRSGRATIKEFEEFMGTGCSLCPDHEGVGGP